VHYWRLQYRWIGTGNFSLTPTDAQLNGAPPLLLTLPKSGMQPGREPVVAEVVWRQGPEVTDLIPGTGGWRTEHATHHEGKWPL
jgi:hypothetical protein